MNEEQKKFLLDGNRKFQLACVALSRSSVVNELIELMNVPGAEAVYQQMIDAVLQKYDLMNGQPMDRAKLEEQKPGLMMGILSQHWLETMSVEKKEQFDKGEVTDFDLLKLAIEKLFAAKGEDEKWKKVKEEYLKVMAEVEKS